MHKQKLNPKIAHHFKTKINKDVGFICLLKLPKIHENASYSSEIQRYSRLEEANYRKTLTNSATTLQKYFRRFLAEKLLSQLKQKKKYYILNQKALVIQKNFRKFKAIKEFKITKLKNKIERLREIAASVIQKNYRVYLLKRNTHKFFLVSVLCKIRAKAALEVQKIGKGFITRKHLYFIRHKKLPLLVTWKYPAHTVSIAGNFTYPPWKQEIPLIYSSYLNLFYSSFFLENNLVAGRYYLKFIVDKMWLCDGNMPISQDLEGNYNNVLTISIEKSKVPRANSSRTLSSQPLLSPHLKPVSQKFPRTGSGSFSSPRAVGFFCNNNSNEKVVLVFGSFMVAHPKKKNAELDSASTADACFTDSDQQIFGIADGVGEWETFGLDPSLFSNELLLNFQKEFKENRLSSAINDLEMCGYLESILDLAYKKTKHFGSSTALLGMCHNSYLYTLSIGDSGYMVLRPRDSGSQFNEIYRSCEQQHSFNCPYQLARLPQPGDYDELARKGLGSLISLLKRNKNEQDLPQDAHAEIIPLQPSDIIIAGSDGLFDNLFDSDILKTSEKIWALELGADAFCEKLAKELVMQAIYKGWDNNYKSPFSKNASRHGKKHVGGKLDDTTVIVALAVTKQNDYV